MNSRENLSNFFRLKLCNVILYSLGGGYGDGTDIRKLAYFESAINPEYASGKVS